MNFEHGMMSEEGIILTDGISRLTLVAIGSPRLGFPTRIEVSSGSFSGVVDAEAWDYGRFRDDLARLHETLAGEAKLTFVDGGHSVTLKGNGFGHIEVVTVIEEDRSPCSAVLTAHMSLDQSHLPDIIHAIQREFLRPQ